MVLVVESDEEDFVDEENVEALEKEDDLNYFLKS